MSKQILPEDKIRAVKEYLEGRTSQQEQAKNLESKLAPSRRWLRSMKHLEKMDCESSKRTINTRQKQSDWQ